MKKRIISIMCMAVFAAVMTFACVGTVTAEASQQGTASDSQVEMEVDGPYLMETVDGQFCFECEIWNDSDEDIYVGITYFLYDASYENIGTLCAFNPCIGPDEGIILNVIDYEGVYESGGDVSYLICSGFSNYDSAEEDLDAGLSMTEKNGYLELTAVNLTSETIFQPEVSIVFYTNDYSDWWVGDAQLTEPGVPYLGVGSAATANIAVPDGYDDWYYCVTGFYNTSGDYVDLITDSASEDTAASGADNAVVSGADSAVTPAEEEDNSYFSSNYFRSNDMSSMNPGQKMDEDLGQD